MARTSFGKFDYLIVGAGPFGAAFARTATDHGKSCLVIDRRDHIAGNTYTKNIEGIDVHMYGAHVFHTNSERIWAFVSRFSEWTPIVHRPLARVGDHIYSLPINLLTLHQLWGVTTPAEAQARLNQERVPHSNPRNAEEWLLSQVGRELYYKLFYGYTKKQWFREPRDLPVSIVSRVPIRLTYNDSYFQAKYQALPTNGYTALFNNMLDGICVELGTDYFDLKDRWRQYASALVFTGPIDKFYGHSFGRLEYRSLRFEFRTYEGDFQGHAVFNYPESTVAYLRTVEHKHFTSSGPKHVGDCVNNSKTIVSYDFPIPPDESADIDVPQYPIRDARNTELYARYNLLAKQTPNVIFGGRLGEFRYYDIDQAIGSATYKAEQQIGVTH